MLEAGSVEGGQVPEGRPDRALAAREREVDGYDRAALERFAPEDRKRADRSPFERDRARVLHSAALRRLAAKTQVVVPWESDFPRTRLTHSLECAQVGRELGRSLGCDPDLVDAACLAHDVGHPPFGHNGEAALNAAAGPCGGFEGNAQSFRLVTRLEAKTFAPDGSPVGLNLTRAALDAATKYPWPRQPEHPHKYGVYGEDLPVFGWVRQGAPEGRRCLEAQVMDWADDVAYSVHDVEDAVHAGHVPLRALRDPDHRTALVALCHRRYAPTTEPAALEEALERLLTLPSWPVDFDGSLPALAALKSMTSDLIGRFTQAAHEATRAAFGAGPLRRYEADLVVPEPVRRECDVLKAITAFYVMERAETARRYADEQEVVRELVEALLAREGQPLEPWLRPAYDRAADDAGRLRVVIDQVASFTDPAALALHARLVGNSRRPPRGR